MIQFFSELKRARLFGHPVHSMLVHFPSGLWPMALLFDLLALFFENHCLACAGFFSIAAGIAMGFIAAVFGALDYARLPPSHTAWNKASLHALLNSIWLILFAIILGLKFKHYPIMLPTYLEICLEIVGVTGLIYSNYLGGELVFHHKLGFDE